MDNTSNTPSLGISETSSTESIARLVKLHREALQNASRKCLPFRDCDEFSAKLQLKTSGNVPSTISFSSSSCVTFVPHRIYTIDEVTEDSVMSIKKKDRPGSSSEELKERLERLKRITTSARNAKRPVSRRGSEPRAPISVIAARINYHEDIAQKFDLIDRFLKDQIEIKQDAVSSDSSIRRRYSHRQSTPEKNRVIGSLCCSCISG